MTSAARPLITDSGYEIQPYIPQTSHFLDRTTVLYGASGSGKSKIIHNILNQLRGHAEQILVVSPTNASNHDFDDYVPMQLIHARMYLPPPPGLRTDTPEKASLRFLREIWNRCEMMTSIYKKANRVAVLKKLYGRVSRKEGDRAIRTIQEHLKLTSHKIRKLHQGNEGLIENEISAAQKRSEEMLVLIYKKYILPEYNELWSANLSEDERHSLTYINFNPRMVLVFDDCAAEMKGLFNKEEFRLVFYQGRHNFLSTIISVQDDTDLPANLRKNAYISIFTREGACESNFSRATNSYPKNIRELVTKQIAPTIYKVRFRVLVYIREDPNLVQFYWIKFPIPIPRMFVNNVLKSMCGMVANDNGELDTENPYHKKFSVT